MSRIGKKLISIPQGVNVTLNGDNIEVSGPNGKLVENFNSLVKVSIDDSLIKVEPVNSSKLSKSMHGTSRSLISNMIEGVTKGFEKKLQLIGVGYRAKIQGNTINLVLGFSHPINYELPSGVSASVNKTATEIVLKSANKQSLGQVAADIRGYRPPEPYKGKGVRYSNEHILRKEAKKK